MLGRHLLCRRTNACRQRPGALLCQYTVLKSPHNQQILDLLSKPLQPDKEAEESNLAPNFFKVQAFTNAIYAVAKLEQPIRSGNDIVRIEGIGPGIIARINDYLLSNESLLSNDPALYQEIKVAQSVKQLSEVPGIGPTTAKKLVDAGCHSLRDLQSGKFSSLLSVKQLAKVKYAGHLDIAKRDEAKNVLDFCVDSLGTEYGCTLVGDYRRGITTFSDIHLMLSHPEFVHVPLPSHQSPESLPEKRSRGRKKKTDGKENLLHTHVIPLFLQRGLIAETFTSTHNSWEGIVRLPGQQSEWNSRTERLAAINHVEGLYRKMTLHFVPQKSRGSSLICLTGDKDFEKNVCYRARERDLLFNEYGLWKWVESPPDTWPSKDSTSDELKASTPGYWSLMDCPTEESIFRVLGMEDIDPTRRNFAFVSSKKKTRKKRTSTPVSH